MKLTDERIFELQCAYTNRGLNGFARAIEAEVLRINGVGGEWDDCEEWEPLAWRLCAEENGEDACNELVWEGGPQPEPWGDRWMKYEPEAKRLIGLVRKYAPQPQQAAPGAVQDGYQCELVSADFNDYTVTVKMLTDYRIRAGRYVLSAVPKPQGK